MTQANICLQLLYHRRPALDFAAIVADLGRGMARASEPAIHWDHADMAIIDFGGGKIVLNWVEDMQGPVAACLSVAVGDGVTRGNRLWRENLARLTVARVAALYPADEERMHLGAGALDPLWLDALSFAIEEESQQEHVAATAPRARELRLAA